MSNSITTICKRAPDGAWEIPILGDIGFFGTNGEDLIRELNAVKPDKVKFIIYSPGGAVYDAIAVAGWIREKGIECYAEIYGVCASAATVFAALAGPKNTAISPGSMFLIHMPYGQTTQMRRIRRSCHHHRLRRRLRVVALIAVLLFTPHRQAYKILSRATPPRNRMTCV